MSQSSSWFLLTVLVGDSPEMESVGGSGVDPVQWWYSRGDEDADTRFVP
jgi:hypothetical protein